MGPRLGEDGAKMDQDGAKMCEARAKMAEDVPRWSQDGAGMEGQDGFRWDQAIAAYRR